MPSLPFSIARTPDVGRLEGERDIDGLIRLLAHRDFTIQWKAASALERLRDEVTTKKLIGALDPTVGSKILPNFIILCLGIYLRTNM
jgi:HEAT repeat protein